MIATSKKNRKLKSVPATNKNTPPQTPSTLLLQYCSDLQNWPDSWAGSAHDIQIGKALVAEFSLLLLDRIQKGRAKSTIKIYAGYLWVLGGELIRQINYTDDDRNLSARQLILKYVDPSGGPLWRHARDDRDHAHYDSVCRQLYKIIAKDPKGT